MKVVQIIISMILFVSLSFLGGSDFGKGLFGVKIEARAEVAAKEVRAILEASSIYALKYGEGEVKLGDPSENEDPLMYIKEKKLLQPWVGTVASKSGIKEWIYDENSKKLMGEIESLELCRYMNRTPGGAVPTTVPECGTEDADGAMCCQDLTGSVGATVTP